MSITSYKSIGSPTINLESHLASNLDIESNGASNTNLQNNDVININLQNNDISNNNLQNNDSSNINLQSNDISNNNLQNNNDTSNINLQSNDISNINLQSNDISNIKFQNNDTSDNNLQNSLNNFIQNNYGSNIQNKYLQNNDVSIINLQSYNDPNINLISNAASNLIFNNNDVILGNNNSANDESSVKIHISSQYESNDNDTYNKNKSENSNNFISNFSNLESKHLFIMCGKCGEIPKIIFKSLKLVNISCKCKNIENESLDELNEYFIYFQNNKVKIDNYTCAFHPLKKFKYFCRDCDRNICKYCKTKDNKHNTHTCNRLISLTTKIKKILDYFNKIKDEGNNNIQHFKLILNSFENLYNNYPNFNLYNAFDSLYKVCCNNNECNENSKKNIININEIIKINSLKMLNEYLNKWDKLDNLNKIAEIEIIRQNFSDIKGLCSLKLINLKRLNLTDNNIQDISSLKDLESSNLKTLTLIRNKIDDKNIESIKDFKFPELTQLHLSNNYFKNYKILGEVAKFQNLNIFYIGGNNFNKKNFENIYLNKAKYEFINLIEIGLTNGVFSDDSIKLITCFNFPKLQILYLSGNNLHSLSFLKNLILPELKEIWLKNNFVKEFNELKRYIKLKKINLENNLIENIDNLKLFIEKIKIEKILLSNNKIDMNEQNKIIINKINESKKIVYI